jgi:hypothetical protein
VSRPAKFERYEQLEHEIQQLELALSGQHVDRITARRLRRKRDISDAELTALHQELHPISEGSPYDPVPKNPLACGYCGDYIFRDRLAKWTAGGLCPRCDPSSPGLHPNDPNYRPGDTIAPYEGGNTR